MNRGAGRQRVFLTQGDGLLFERLLGEACELVGAEVHAYCLMSNHFHLLLHCPNGGVSEFMQRTASLYTKGFNARVGRDGPVFRSRFHSLVVESPEYLDRVGRDIHRNPTDVSPPVSLQRYRWSSFRCYAGRSEAPCWLRLTRLLDMHGGERRAYTTFVEGEIVPGRLRLEAVEAVIEMLLDECDEVEIGQRRGLARVVAIGMLERSHGEVRASLEQLLAFTSAGSRRVALHRASRRFDEFPTLARVVDRAIDLAA
jgi:REP element-mobilizing transposase RayT